MEGRVGRRASAEVVITVLAWWEQDGIRGQRNRLDRQSDVKPMMQIRTAVLFRYCRYRRLETAEYSEITIPSRTDRNISHLARLRSSGYTLLGQNGTIEC